MSNNQVIVRYRMRNDDCISRFKLCELGVMPMHSSITGSNTPCSNILFQRILALCRCRTGHILLFWLTDFSFSFWFISTEVHKKYKHIIITLQFEAFAGYSTGNKVKGQLTF
jgi:hypothetical protein